MSESANFEIIPINDNPINDATLLGHNEIVDTLKRFIESKHMISSSSVALHGDWGSGKTSVMKTLETTLDKTKNEVLFFEAWKYEYTNPSIGLVAEIGYKLSTSEWNFVDDLIKSAIYVLTDWFLGSRVSDNLATIIGNVSKNKEQIQSLTDTLQQAIDNLDKRLIIIIDDLDRCDVENSLQILALMKLFLSLDNCVVIAAVDFKRLEQAWKMKYQIKGNNDNEARSYLEKIFQIRIAIPVPDQDRIMEYYREITKDMPNELLELFAELGPSNPRAIKRMLNLISYRIFLLASESTRLYSVCLWTILESYFGNPSLFYFEDRIRQYGSSFAKIPYQSDWKMVKEIFAKFIPSTDFNKIGMEKLLAYYTNANKLLDKLAINENDLVLDFDVLYTNTKEMEKPQLSDKFVGSF